MKVCNDRGEGFVGEPAGAVKRWAGMAAMGALMLGRETVGAKRSRGPMQRLPCCQGVFHSRRNAGCMVTIACGWHSLQVPKKQMHVSG